ncbi:DNA internalization-related competence protein ComEC/Rec2 [Alcanivorax sp. DP30]|uniref:DNA internalization-related competence protein ComEC/Rec2 n=1 Tax=Alcanivorax sp. DP30 TaxID=2606217 RepID=UPI00136BBAD1|nr:DNA internalization-related competence protein ComEC/Rec2 [Alcanivorax sp. DP30]MZR62051.1 DNA internalization-related competence protein ComEC/Rec2 [Alcanivorax sp. DP30]
MRRWGMAFAMIAGSGTGALGAVLACLLIALLLARGRLNIWLLLPVACFYGAWHLQLGVQQRLPAGLEGEILTMAGTVMSVPENRERFRFGRLQQEQHFIFQAGNHPRWPGEHRIRISSYGPDRLVNAGEHLRLSLKLKAGRGLYNATGMDLARHDLAAGIAARSTLKKAVLISEGQGLAYWRQQLSASIYRAVQTSPAARGVLPALVVGDRSGLDTTLMSGFQSTGAAHLLAISGLHVAIVAGAVWWFGRGVFGPLCHWLWPRSRRLTQQQLGWLPALGVALGYSALAGFSLPTQRALVMLSVVALASLCRREVSLWSSLGWALLVVLLLQPLSALSESLWLSFAAVAVIAALMNGHSGRRLMLLLPVLMTLLSAALFGQWSLLSPLANLLLIPLYSLLIIPLTLLGAITGLEVLLQGAGAAVELSVVIMEGLSRWSEPLAKILPLPELASALCLMAGLFLLLLPAVPFPRRLLPFWLLPWLTQSLPPLEQGQWELTAFDVGQGLALAVRTRDHLLLYDTGASWSGGSMAQSIIVPWLSRNQLTPDRLVVSHGDNDHAGGNRDFDAAIPRLSGEPERVSGSVPCVAGDQWVWDGVRFSVLWPPLTAPQGNDASCVILVEGNGMSLLLPGDVGRDVEYQLLGNWPQVDLLVLAHHGSKSSTSAALLREVAPSWALASAGYQHYFGHPHAEVLARLAKSGVTVLRTDEDGMIVFRGYGHDNVPLITKWRQEYVRPWQQPAGWRFW